MIPSLSFGHNLCFRCPNGQCEPTLDICTSIAFQWYKKLFKEMGFDPCNCALKIWESIWDSNSPCWEFPWECEGSFPHTLYTLGNMWCDSRISLLARNLATPCLGREPKARVMTFTLHYHSLNLEDYEPSHLNFFQFFYHVLLLEDAIHEVPHLLQIWRDLKANNTMYCKDLLKDWLLDHLEDYI